MVPRHAGAILSCSQAWLRDPEIDQLRESIVAPQEAEVALL
jgi:uncharacterized protein (DUF305 family)